MADCAACGVRLRNACWSGLLCGSCFDAPGRFDHDLSYVFTPQYAQQYGRFGLGRWGNGLGDISGVDPVAYCDGRKTSSGSLAPRSWRGSDEDVSAGAALKFAA